MLNAVVPERKSRYIRSGGRLPPFAAPGQVLVEVLDLLTPPSRISVSEAAEKYRVINDLTYKGPWVSDQVLYMKEPMDQTTSRKYRAVVFVGPARTGKTDALVLCVILHRAMCQPRKVLLVNMDQKSAADYSSDEIDKMIRYSVDLAERQERGRGASTLYQKLFKGGMRLVLGWPVISFFAQKTIPDVLITDRDRMTDDIGGEGDPLSLGMKRGETLGSLAMTVVESSPGRDIKDKDWKAETIHQAPPCDGILSDYNLGTRARLYWKCPHCDDQFEPDFSAIKWDEKDNIQDTSLTAHMVCGSGCIIEAAEKRKMNIEAEWLHESRDGKSLVRIDDPDIRPTDIVSYWLKGGAAAFQPWSRLVQEWLQAQEVFEKTGSEKKLKATVNTSQGLPYLPNAINNESDLNADDLKSRAEFRKLGVVPKGVHFLTVQVDVNGTFFSVQVDGWGPGMERWLVDRFDIVSPPETSPGAKRDKKGNPKRSIKPSRYIEDWDVLTELHKRVWPVDGADYGLRPAIIVIDMHGEPGVTDRAYKFWRDRRKDGLKHRFQLIRGVKGDEKVPRAVKGFPETRTSRKKKIQSDIPILSAASNRLKDEVCASLLREEAGPMSYHLPSQLDQQHFEEFCAERRGDKGWEKKKSSKRNECFDLAYYGKAAVIIMGAEKINWDRPPAWAVLGPDNSLAIGGGNSSGKPNSASGSEPKKTMTMAQRLAARARARIGA